MEQVLKQHDWEEQSLRMIGLINIARITILFSLLIFLAVIHNLKGMSGSSSYMPLVKNSAWLQLWCLGYGCLILISFARPTWQLQKRDSLPNISAVIDLTMTALLTFLAGGAKSGFGILMLPFLATSCLLSYGRFPLLYGSYASMLVLIDLFWRVNLFADSWSDLHFTLVIGQVVFIGACYLVPLLTSFSARYLSIADARVRRHKTALERMSALNHIVLNRVQEVVVVVDSQCRVWLFNHQAKKYFPDLTNNQAATLFIPFVKQWRIKPTQPFEESRLLNQHPMHVRAMPLIQENTELLMLFIRSEEERQHEAQQVKLTSLGLLTANLAHEIRNPLSAMRQANGWLMENSASSHPMTQRLTNIIEKNITRIDKMIEDVSALNKRDRTNTKTIPMMKFWLHFIQEFQLTRPESAGCIKLELDNQELTAEFDPMHLQQILWNLCNNAWRHSHQQRNSVIIRIKSTGSLHIRLQVWDDGPGVSPTLLPHLFEPFQTTQSEGTGLGLYVARELAHANKGDLRYDAKNKAFELTLPRKQNDEK